MTAAPKLAPVLRNRLRAKHLRARRLTPRPPAVAPRPKRLDDGALEMAELRGLGEVRLEWDDDAGPNVGDENGPTMADEIDGLLEAADDLAGGVRRLVGRIRARAFWTVGLEEKIEEAAGEVEQQAVAIESGAAFGQYVVAARLRELAGRLRRKAGAK